LPGLFEVERIVRLSQEFHTEILAKVVFSFTPDIIMSPLALPRYILDRKITELVNCIPDGALKEVLLQLKTRPTFAEQWPGEYKSALSQGKRRIQQLEQIRNDSYTLADILKEDKEIADWYEQIIT
jgi:hypothetical protein